MEQTELETYVAQVVNDAERTVGTHLDRPLLEAYAREAVLDLWLTGGDVTIYTAELALNQIYDQITRRSQAVMARTSCAA